MASLCVILINVIKPSTKITLRQTFGLLNHDQNLDGVKLIKFKYIKFRHEFSFIKYFDRCKTQYLKNENK